MKYKYNASEITDDQFIGTKPFALCTFSDSHLYVNLKKRCTKQKAEDHEKPSNC